MIDKFEVIFFWRSKTRLKHSVQLDSEVDLKVTQKSVYRAPPLRDQVRDLAAFMCHGDKLDMMIYPLLI